MIYQKHAADMAEEGEASSSAPAGCRSPSGDIIPFGTLAINKKSFILYPAVPGKMYEALNMKHRGFEPRTT